MVAIHFIKDLSDTDLEVNHIDTNRKNNIVTNLEWVTHKDNILHSAKLGNMSHYGKDNPNYGNKKLSQLYSKDKELSKLKNGRKGSNNGMAKSIVMITNQDEIKFSYIRECAEYLISNKLVKQKSKDTVANKITKAIKENSYYGNSKFRYS